MRKLLVRFFSVVSYSIITLTIFIVFPIQSANATWFKTVGGSVHSQQDIDPNIPVPPPPLPPGDYHFSISDPNIGESGIISAFGNVSNFGQGSESNAAWVIGPSVNMLRKAPNAFNFDHYLQLLGPGNPLPIVGGNPLLDPDHYCLMPPSGIYYFDASTNGGTINISCPAGSYFGTVASGFSHIFLIDNGDLNINAVVQTGRTAGASSFLAFIVDGDINFENGIPTILGGTPFDETNPNIEGIFISGGMIDVQPFGQPLYLEGIFIGWSEIRARRNGPPHEVREWFIYRPDLLWYSPLEMRDLTVQWNEVFP
ncbi:hypothetical protein HY468_04755 [Candidatus Roizmanbacteria bacterium]|nr:hypothetical protein [Candidatus Roizmanbacteria bacterium]